MITLGIETSCDETAAALVKEGEVLSSEISSSVHLHSDYGGVVPEIASRFHTEYIVPVLGKALSDAGAEINDVDLVAVTNGPGLPGSLLVGIAFAKSLSFALERPVIGVNHLHAHMLSCFLGKKDVPGDDIFPFIGAVVSGGHTSIYLCRSLKDIAVIGRTKDDAAGEAFDKVAKILGLGYPGGPAVEARAANYKGEVRIPFPRALLGREGGLDFSFSGIKTAVMYHWRSCRRTEEEKDRICCSFQEAIVDVLVEKLSRAARQAGLKRLAVGGGVINNGSLRAALERMCRDEGLELFLPDKRYCGDNAAMVASLGEMLFGQGVKSDLYLNACPGCV